MEFLKLEHFLLNIIFFHEKLATFKSPAFALNLINEERLKYLLEKW